MNVQLAGFEGTEGEGGGWAGAPGATSYPTLPSLKTKTDFPAAKKTKRSFGNERGVAVVAVVFIAMFFTLVGMMVGAKNPKIFNGKTEQGGTK